jgi:ATP-binding cassette, subfamily F, member 3
MLTLSEVTKAYGARTLFAQASLQINATDRIGFVGPNGSGKSTLFSLILGQQEPDEGKILLDRRASLGYLPQETAPAGNETVLELATACSPAYIRQQGWLKTDSSAAAESITDHASAYARFEELGGHELEHRAEQILAGLGFRPTDFTRPARELSGGWIMRARLAQLLVHSPTLLMLDEPTNHLDLEALLWFQNYLLNYPGAILLISHDREFLNTIVDHIVEFRQGRLLRYRGNYESFLEQRAARIEQLEAAYKNQQREIARLMTFVDRFRAKNTKATQAQSKLKQIERMEKIEAPDDAPAEFSFVFPKPARSGRRVISLQDVAHAYGETTVYQHLEFEAERGQRIVLVGPNGAGKSTLLKLLAGIIPVQSGTRELGYQVKSGYYSQHRLETLHADSSVLQEGLDTPQRVSEQFVRTVLGSFGFSGDDVFKPVNVLSGGEKSRLALVKLLLDPPNLLLMDEPTTHLDMSGVEALIEALQQFDGTLIFISHDVFFIRALANQVVQVKSGQLRQFKGEYQYYVDKTTAEAASLAALTSSIPKPETEPDDRPSVRTREQKRLEAELRQSRSRARQAQQQIVDELETEIVKLESRQGQLTAELEHPDTYLEEGRAAIITRELADISRRLPELTKSWETEAAKLLAL